MNIDYSAILQKYWGYSSFRPLQEDIIRSVASGNDTLGLMPTGGGKSITFQVYSLSVDGICLVVTPLIALMNDQVENLTKRGIKAMAIHSGMSREEIKVALDNVTWGDFKFLYLSPERIMTERFKERLPHMNINLIVVDEAHCISQWGYDFRPSYLQIARLRELLPTVKVMALTATATPQVVDDIQHRLLFPKKNVLKKSFSRDNLMYKVRIEDDKLGFLLRTLEKSKGSGIIYTRSRKKTKEIAEELLKKGISATYYNAGLSAQTRRVRQEEWIKGAKRIMVATNAFGMGIDKPDVRFVAHVDAPDSLEAYFQEAGRAGRDGKKAVALFLANKSDSVRLKKGIAEKFPPIDLIKRVYDALGNYFKIAVGFGKDVSYDFNLADFAKTYHFSLIQSISALKILEQDGYIQLTDEVERPSMVHFRVDRDDLYKFQVANSNFDAFIKLLLRSYSGLFTEYRPVDEELLAKRAGITRDLVYKFLSFLDSQKIIHYIPQKNTPYIIYTTERIDVNRLVISKENYALRKQMYEKQLGAVISYIEDTSVCRSQQLLAYFGETGSARCGACDVCEALNSLGISNLEFDRIQNDVKALLKKEPLLKHQLFFKINGIEENIHWVIRWLFENEKIVERIDGKVEWKDQ